jgi:type IV secretion system protein TrbI
MPESPSGIPEIKDRRPKVTGLLPKNAQTRVLAGLAILMVLVMMFSGRKSAPTKAGQKAITASQSATAAETDTTRVKEYTEQLEEQTRKLAQEEAELTQTKRGFEKQIQAPGSAPITGVQGTYPMPAAYAPAYAATPEKDWIEADRQKREYEALYASNIALSYRGAAKEKSTDADADHVAGAASQTQSAAAKKDSAQPTQNNTGFSKEQLSRPF